MIDPHIHLRDWNQNQKETIGHELYIAWKAGLDAVFEMPNNSPAITSTSTIFERLELVDNAIEELKKENAGFKIFHGLYVNVTADLKQILEVVSLYNGLFPHVVGLKMFAGESIGDIGVIDEKEQLIVYMNLARFNYKGLLAVHCEKEAKIRKELLDHSDPFTHTLARPPEAEVESVKDQVRFAKEAEFQGILHICHISVPEALEYIEKERERTNFRITCGITPHHAMLYDEIMKSENGLLLKMNPPLRPKHMQEYMFQALLDGRIDWIETDHTPHTLEDKINPNKENPFASGIPVLPFYPHFIKFLRDKGMSHSTINDLTHNNIVKTFGIKIENSFRTPSYDLADEYEFDTFKKIK